MGAAVDWLRKRPVIHRRFHPFRGCGRIAHPSGATAAGCPVLAAVAGRVDRGGDHCE